MKNLQHEIHSESITSHDALENTKKNTRTSGGLRILMVYPYIPFPLNRGTYHRVFNLCRELCRNHQVDLFCLDSEEGSEVAPLKELCSRVEVAPFEHPAWPSLFPDRLLNPLPTTIRHWDCPPALERLKDFTEGRKYDLVHFCDLVMWPYVKEVLNEIGESTPCVMDRSRVDLLFQQEELAHLKLSIKERMLRWENLMKLKRFEFEISRKLKSTVVCGLDDETFLRANVDQEMPIKVLANGVDDSFFNLREFPRELSAHPSVLFCGAMDYTPNVDALRWFFKEIYQEVHLEIPEIEILIVGKSPIPEVQAYGELPGVTVTGMVPDVRPYYQKSWVQMVPLRIGGGTRLKIVESLAMECPVVSTTIGAQGLSLQDGEHVLLGDTAHEFIGALVRILKNPEIRDSVAEQGRLKVLETLTWRSLGETLSTYYKEKCQ